MKYSDSMTKKYEDNPFEDGKVAREWINSIENEKGMIRERELFPMLAKWVEEIQPKVVVDIGMGQGSCTDVIQSNESIRYIGVEPSVILVNRAKEKYAKKNREYMVGNAYELPLPNAVADSALAINVWFHLKDLETASRELARVLQPSGKFLICTANPDAYEEWLSRFDKDAKVEGKTIDGKIYVPVNPLSRNLFFRHSMKELLDAFSHNHLSIDRTELNGIFDRSAIPLFITFFGHKSI